MPGPYEADVTPPTIDDPAEIQMKLEKAVNPPTEEEEEAAQEEEEVGIEHTFRIDMFSKMEGVQRKGTFTNRILTPQQEIQKGTIRSQLLSQCASNVDFPTSYRAEQMAHLTVSLTKKPKWFNAQRCEDKAVLAKVYQEAASHEARFWGMGEDVDEEITL